MLAQLPEKMLNQLGDVLPVLTQWRHGDRNHVQPVIQILAKSLLLDEPFEVLVRRGDDADVDAHRFARTDAFKDFFLQHAQEFHLHIERNVADFIEKEGAAVGRFEAADFVADRPRKGALDVSEQFTFEQGGRQGGAMHFDKRLVRPSAMIVDGPSQQFLSGSALTADQHRRGARRHLSHQVEQVADHSARTHEIGVCGRGRRRVGWIAALRLDRALPHQLPLQGKNSLLLFGDFLDLRLQIAVERFDGSPSRHALKGKRGDRRQRRQ